MRRSDASILVGTRELSYLVALYLNFLIDGEFYYRF